MERTFAGSEGHEPRESLGSRGSEASSRQTEAGRDRVAHPEPHLGMDSSAHAPTLPDASGGPTSRSPEQALSQRVGRFTVLEEIGRGGMGIVYAAYDPDLDRKVAVKVLQAAAYANDDSSEGPARLLREAQAMARLSHPNVATVHEVGTVDDQVFLAMEFIEGRTLKAWVAEVDDMQAWRTIVAMYRQAGEGLAAAHRAGLIHRDFKPDNVLVDAEDRAKVLDFGLARAQRVPGAEPPASDVTLDGSSLDTPLTQAGQVMGTPAYMAPEQMLGDHLDERTDQFSFCVALYEALYGERPFPAKTFVELRLRVFEGGPPKAPEHASVPGWLLRVLLRGLRQHPAERYDSMEELLDALGRDPGRRRRRLGWGLAAAAVLLVGAGVTVTYVRAQLQRAQQVEDPCAEPEASLSGIWDDERRRTIRDAFSRTGLGYAEGTWSRVRGRLDDYAERWTHAQQAVCRATAVEHTQPESLQLVRQACLGRRLSELRAQAAVLARADPQVVQAAVVGIDALHDPDECRTVETMRIEMPLPANDDAARRVVEQRQRLDDVTALVTSGHHEDALALAEQVVAEAEGLAYLPLLAEAKLKLGVTLDKKGRYDDAARVLEEALFAAEVGRHDAATVDAWNEWLRTVGYHQGRHEVASATLPRLDAALRRLGRDPGREAAAFKTRGTLAFAMGDFPEAVRHFRAGQQILERTLGADHSQTAILYQNLGTALQRRGRYDEAERVLGRGLEIWSANRGAQHPGLASIHETLGDVALSRGDAEAAVEHFERALELFTQANDAQHPEMALRYRDLGQAHAQAGRGAEALGWLRKAVEAERARLGGPEPPFVSSLLLARALLAQGDHDEVVSVLEEVLAHPEVDREPRPAIRFTLAQGLWGSDPRARARARRLATQARESFAREGRDDERAQVQRWLDTARPG